MRLGIFAKTFPGTVPGPVLGAAAGAGYAVTQYNMSCSGLPSMPDAVADDAALAVAEAAQAANVEIVALSGTYNMIHPDAAERELGHRRLNALAGAATRMGTRVVTLCTGTRDPDDQWRGHPDNDSPNAWRDLRAAMDRALLVAETHDIDLGIEPELANVVDSAAKARRLIDEIGSARLKIIFDAANLFEAVSLGRQRDIVSAAIDLIGDRIVMAHAKDRTASGGFTAAGQGVLDYAHYLDGLARAGFDGPLITHGLTAAEAPGVAGFLQAALAHVGHAPH